MRAVRMWFLWAAALTLASCGGGNQGSDLGATDLPADLAADVVADVAPDVTPDPGTPPLVAPPGCPEYTTPPGGDIAEVRIDPPLADLQVPFGGNSQVKFTATLIYRSGTPPVTIPAGPFVLTDPSVGSIDNTGLFSTADKAGGETFVTLTMGGVCGSAHLRVIQSWTSPGDSGVTDPGQAWVTTGNPTEDTSLELAYPPDNALAPADFPPITVQWKAPASGEVGVVRVESVGARFDFLFNPANAKVAKGFALKLDPDGWEKLFQIGGQTRFTVRVLLAQLKDGQVTGPVRASPGRTLSVTFERAGGAFYYWNTGGNGTIRYLEFGKEKSSLVKTASGGCVGCHSIAPDASVVATNAFGISGGMSMWPLTLSDPVTGKVPSWIHENALKQFQASNSIAPAFSPRYWNDSEKRIVSPGGSGGMTGGTGSLFSIDLINGIVKPMQRTGDAGGPGFPTWSPQGGDVVYASAKGMGSDAAFAMSGSSKLVHIPYNDGMGGPAEVVKGADEEGVLQYYPAYSPDGLWILYNRADNKNGMCPTVNTGSTGATPGSTYDNCWAEVWIVPSSGGTAIRLDRANGADSPGNANSWPTFGVSAGQHYWIAFASRREYGVLHTAGTDGTVAPQIWIAAVDPGLLLQGKDGSYAALWLPYQEIESGNHIARWGTTLRQAK